MPRVPCPLPLMRKVVVAFRCSVCCGDFLNSEAHTDLIGQDWPWCESCEEMIARARDLLLPMFGRCLECQMPDPAHTMECSERVKVPGPEAAGAEDRPERSDSPRSDPTQNI